MPWWNKQVLRVVTASLKMLVLFREWKSTRSRRGFLLKPQISHVHEVGPWIWNPQMTKPSCDDSHKHDPKLYRSLGDDPTVTNQQKSPTVTRHQPLKMSQQTHGIPKKERPRMTKRRMLRSSPKAGQKGTNIFPMIQMYRDHGLTRWWQLKYIFSLSPFLFGER